MKQLLLLLVLTAVLLGISKGTDRLYNYCVRGVWMEHSGNSHGILSTLIYTSGEEDAALFEDETLKGLYEEILSQADEQGLRSKYAPEGWVDLSSHYADSYDAIGYGIINPVIQGYVAEQAALAVTEQTEQTEQSRVAAGIAANHPEVAAALEFDAYCKEMTGVLMGQEKGNLMQVLGANIIKGFVNSIARVNRYLNIYALGAYVLYLLLYVWVVWKKKNWIRQEETITFAEIVLGGVIGNVLVVGVTIFCQPRYMIYNMGLFYSALSVLLYDFAKGHAWGRKMLKKWEKR